MARMLRRYESTIYGNYRQAYVKYGLVVGLLYVAYILVRWALGFPLKSSVDYGLELVLFVGIMVCTYRYRKGLSKGKVMFKELMLLGLGIGVVSAVVLFAFVCLYCTVLNPESMTYFTESLVEATKNPETGVTAQQVVNITASSWGMRMALHSAILSIIIAFVAALLFRTELNKERVKK